MSLRPREPHGPTTHPLSYPPQRVTLLFNTRRTSQWGPGIERAEAGPGSVGEGSIMLTLWGPGGDDRYCDGRSRRAFLQLGGLAMGGLSLPALLQAEAQARGGGSSHKSVIMIYLTGGPAHQDTFDLKPDAPEGIRGEYKPIATRLPGVQICEHLPRIAGLMDRV